MRVLEGESSDSEDDGHGSRDEGRACREGRRGQDEVPASGHQGQDRYDVDNYVLHCGLKYQVHCWDEGYGYKEEVAEGCCVVFDNEQIGLIRVIVCLS